MREGKERTGEPRTGAVHPIPPSDQGTTQHRLKEDQRGSQWHDGTLNCALKDTVNFSSASDYLTIQHS